VCKSPTTHHTATPPPYLGGEPTRGLGRHLPEGPPLKVSLSYVRWTGPTAPTFTPRHHIEQATCVDHLVIWDPHHMSIQTEDTQTLPSAFLDHNGVLGRIHLPLLSSEAVAPPRQGPAGTHVPISYPEIHYGGVEIQGIDRHLRLHLTREGYGSNF
jgi:hypothetical protein